MTVSKSQVYYHTLRAEGLDRDNLVIVFPRGERSTGKLRDGKAGFGFYYYISIHGSLPQYLEVGDHLLVELSKDGLSSQVILKYC